jgi:hypothetical protein
VSLLWADSVNRVGSGRKVHAYERGNGGFVRQCGVRDSDGPLKRRDLVRVEVVEWAKDANTCESCKTSLGVAHYEPQPRGAESVNYDPFGVFGGEDSG